MSRKRRPEPLTITCIPASAGAGSGSAIGSARGKRRRASIGQPMQIEMLPAAPSLAAISLTRYPAVPIAARNSSSSGKA